MKKSQNNVHNVHNVHQLHNWEQKAEEGFNFLVETDEEHARLRAKVNLYAEMRKQIVALGVESCEHLKAVEAKRQYAHTTEEYQKHIRDQEELEFEYFHLHNRRERAQQAIDFFRTYSANTRKG